MIERLENSGEVITVEFISNNNDRYNDHKVYWDPTSGLITGQGGIQTPALGLAHEFGHADDELSNSNYYVKPLAQKEEFAMNLETSIARELGEPERRSYSDEKGEVRVVGPTSSTVVTEFQRGISSNYAYTNSTERASSGIGDKNDKKNN